MMQILFIEGQKLKQLNGIWISVHSSRGIYNARISQNCFIISSIGRTLSTKRNVSKDANNSVIGPNNKLWSEWKFVGFNSQQKYLYVCIFWNIACVHSLMICYVTVQLFFVFSFLWVHIFFLLYLHSRMPYHNDLHFECGVHVKFY